MPGTRSTTHRLAFLLGAGIASAIAVLPSNQADAQIGLVQQQVGGVSVDARGVLDNVRPDALNNLRDVRKRSLKNIPAGLSGPNELRKVSLRQLQTTLLELRKDLSPLPNDVRLLGGLQRVEYVLVYPEEKDIVLAGFGEGWRVDEQANIVGLTTGRPLLRVDDLLAALRTGRQAARGGISCSIDPTADGMRRLQEFVSSLTTVNNLAAAVTNIEQQLGPQTITLQGIPTTSHFAHVMVAADYRMKRIAMKFDPSPVRGLPSYLDLIGVGGGRGMNNLQPRWWLAMDYEPLLTDAEGLSWQIRGRGVKAMTEDAHFAANGQRLVQEGKTSPPAQKWADFMTEKYDALSVRSPIFGELRNCMDLAVVGALIFKEDLAGKAGLDMSALLSDEQLPLDQYPAPQQTDSKCSFVKKSGNWVISVSGGVLMDPWSIVTQKEQTEKLDSLHKKATPAKGSVPTEHCWSN